MTDIEKMEHIIYLAKKYEAKIEFATNAYASIAFMSTQAESTNAIPESPSMEGLASGTLCRIESLFNKELAGKETDDFEKNIMNQNY